MADWFLRVAAYSCGPVKEELWLPGKTQPPPLEPLGPRSASPNLCVTPVHLLRDTLLVYHKEMPKVHEKKFEVYVLVLKKSF